MNKQAERYEIAGDTATSKSDAEKAYRAAQNHLSPNDSGYMDDFKRLQNKIIEVVGALGK